VDELLKKYTEKILGPGKHEETAWIEKLLLQFLLEYVESKESKKDGEK